MIPDHCDPFARVGRPSTPETRTHGVRAAPESVQHAPAFVVNAGGALEFSVPVPVRQEPTDRDRTNLHRMLGQRSNGSCFECDGGSVRFSKAAKAPWCSSLGECGASLCGCYRLTRPRVRGEFVTMVHTRAKAAVGDTLRYATIGSGCLLTDFEIVLGFWASGVRIESVVAIDPTYGTAESDEATQARKALAQFATFFAPARVFAFGSVEAYRTAAQLQPAVYGRFNCFVKCDANPVPLDEFLSAASNLVPNALALELHNHGAGSGRRENGPLESYLPPTLRHRKDGHSTSSVTVRRRLDWNTAEPHQGPDVKHAHDNSFEDVSDPTEASTNPLPIDCNAEALKHLRATARERAAKRGLRMFRVVFSGGPRMPLRKEPSRTSTLLGAIDTGDEVIVRAVRDDGWVQLSELDTYWGFRSSVSEAAMATEGFMLTQADDVGQLLEEIILDPPRPDARMEPASSRDHQDPVDARLGDALIAAEDDWLPDCF